MQEETSPNAEQATYWNDTAGPKWVALQDRIDAQIEPLGLVAMDNAQVATGEAVIDVGCGCGQTSLELGRRVAPDGSVTGVDISQPMLERARSLAEAEGLSHVSFERTDAQVHRFAAGSANLVFSRFGVMFFSDPTAAFANLRKALAADGRLSFACWQSIFENPWMLTPVMAVGEHIELPPPPEPGVPGPFAFADPERVRRILEDAGFRDVRLEDHRTAMQLGASDDLDEIVDFAMQMGPAGAVLRDAPTEKIEQVAIAIRKALEPHRTDGGVRMDAACWMVTARA